MSTIPETNLLTFKNHGELLKTLVSLPKNMVCLLGYVDEKGDIQELDSKLLSTQKAEMVRADKLILETILTALETCDNRFLDEQGIYIKSYLHPQTGQMSYDSGELTGAKKIVKHLLDTLNESH